MIWLSIAVFLNSVAIIVILRTKRLKKDHFKVINDRINRNQIRCDKAMEDIENLRKENRNIRSEVIEKMPHQPLCDSDFIYGGWNARRFGGELKVNDKFIGYVANIALKTIVSELPEKIQTQEIVNEIIKRMKGELTQSKIKL